MKETQLEKPASLIFSIFSAIIHSCNLSNTWKHTAFDFTAAFNFHSFSIAISKSSKSGSYFKKKLVFKYIMSFSGCFPRPLLLSFPSAMMEMHYRYVAALPDGYYISWERKFMQSLKLFSEHLLYSVLPWFNIASKKKNPGMDEKYYKQQLVQHSRILFVGTSFYDGFLVETVSNWFYLSRKERIVECTSGKSRKCVSGNTQETRLAHLLRGTARIWTRGNG